MNYEKRLASTNQSLCPEPNYNIHCVQGAPLPPPTHRQYSTPLPGDKHNGVRNNPIRLILTVPVCLHGMCFRYNLSLTGKHNPPPSHGASVRACACVYVMSDGYIRVYSLSQSYLSL